MEHLVSTVDQISKLFIYVYYYSYKTGQFFVYLTTVLFKTLTILLNSCIGLVIILLESLLLFLQDVMQGFLQLSSLLIQFLEDTNTSVGKIASILKETIEKVTACAVTVCRIPGQAVWTLWTVLIRIIVLCKSLLVLFGSGVWFAITLIPYSMANLIYFCIDYIEECYNNLISYMLRLSFNIKQAFSRSYEFITDVPVESLLGIIVAASLIYIFTQFYIIIISFCYYQTRNTFVRIYRKLKRLSYQTRLRLRLYFQTPEIERTQAQPLARISRRPQVRSALNKTETSKTDEGRYCVICQERPKCVLVLPCRHVCMCDECSARLQLYSNICPICRNNIDETMRVFV